MRRRSSSWASTIRARDARTDSSCARTSAWRRSFSAASRTAATAADTRPGSSRSAGSWAISRSGVGPSPIVEDRATARVGLGGEAGERRLPAVDLQRRVAQRVAQRGLQCRERRQSVEPDDEVGDPAAGPLIAQDADQQCDRHEHAQDREDLDPELAERLAGARRDDRLEQEASRRTRPRERRPPARPVPAAVGPAPRHAASVRRRRSAHRCSAPSGQASRSARSGPSRCTRRSRRRPSTGMSGTPTSRSGASRTPWRPSSPPGRR